MEMIIVAKSRQIQSQDLKNFFIMFQKQEIPSFTINQTNNFMDKKFKMNNNSNLIILIKLMSSNIHPYMKYWQEPIHNTFKKELVLRMLFIMYQSLSNRETHLQQRRLRIKFLMSN